MVNISSKGSKANAEAAVWTSLPNNVASSWWKDAGLRKLNMLMSVVMLSTFIIGYDGSLIGGLLTMPRWFMDIGAPDANLLGLVIAAQSFGGLIAFIPVSFALDKFGRKKVVMLGDVIVIAAAIGQMFSFSAPAVLGTRLVLGIGTVTSSSAGPVLLTELAHPKYRGPTVGIAGSFFFIGAICSSWVCFGTVHLQTIWCWRIPVLLQVLAPTIQFCLVPFVPESPRWLIHKGRVEEARAILCKYHANGKVDDALVSHEYNEIIETLDAEARNKTGWKSFYATPGNRKRFFLSVSIALAGNWVGNGIISYYFPPVLASVGITSPTQQAGINCGLQIWNWIFAIAGALSVDKIGRKPLLLLSCSIMLVSMVIVCAGSAVFADKGSKGAGYVVIVFLFIFNAGYDIALTPLPTLYTSEVMPFHLRAKGVALNFMAAFTGGFFNQYVNPIALEAIHWKFYIVYIVVIIAFACLVHFYYVETANLTIEEVAAKIDGPKQSTLTAETGMMDDKLEAEIDKETENVERVEVS